MEWVETTAKTVEEAKELALDQLGVDEADAEFEVIERIPAKHPLDLAIDVAETRKG